MEMKLVYSKLKQHIRSLAYFKLDQDDLLQEAVLKVLRSKSYKTGFGPGLLHSVARSVVYDAHKRFERERSHYSGYLDTCGQVCEVDDENVIYHPTYFDRFHEVAPEELEDIPEILASLSYEHQEVLVFYANGLTYQEISHMTGLAIGTVRSRVHYARKRAHKLIDEKRKKENETATVTWTTSKK